jgi:hypothetical protein
MGHPAGLLALESSRADFLGRNSMSLCWRSENPTLRKSGEGWGTHGVVSSAARHDHGGSQVEESSLDPFLKRQIKALILLVV